MTAGSVARRLAGRRAESLGALREALALGRDRAILAAPCFLPRALSELLAEALRAGIEADHARALIRALRLAAPAAAADLEAWPWPVRIYALGRFEVVVNGEPLRSGAKGR